MLIPQVVKEFSALRKLHCSVTRIRHLSQMHLVHALRSCLISLFRIKVLIKITLSHQLIHLHKISH